MLTYKILKVLFIISSKVTNIFVNQLKLGKKTLFTQVGHEAEEKHQGGQTAMKSPMPPASVEIGSANCPNPEQVLIPPKQGLKPPPLMSSGIY